jgi:hypothetical protein
MTANNNKWVTYFLLIMAELAAGGGTLKLVDVIRLLGMNP